MDFAPGPANEDSKSDFSFKEQDNKINLLEKIISEMKKPIPSGKEYGHLVHYFFSMETIPLLKKENPEITVQQ